MCPSMRDCISTRNVVKGLWNLMLKSQLGFVVKWEVFYERFVRSDLSSSGIK